MLCCWQIKTNGSRSAEWIRIILEQRNIAFAGNRCAYNCRESILAIKIDLFQAIVISTRRQILVGIIIVFCNSAFASSIYKIDSIPVRAIITALYFETLIIKFMLGLPA